MLVANLTDFAHWRGTDPLPKEERRALHLWSQFTSELPERFRPQGPTGHQFVPASDFDELERLRIELFDYVRARWPGTVVEKSFETWTAHRPDGARLNVEFSPSSEYDRCTDDLAHLNTHVFDGDRSCVVWSIEPGRVEIIRTHKGDLVLAQVEFAESDEQAAAAVQETLEMATAGSEPVAALWEVTNGPIVVVWAPNSANDIDDPSVYLACSVNEPGVHLNLSTDQSGALLALPRGVYEVTTGVWAHDDAGVNWCAFRRRDSVT